MLYRYAFSNKTVVSIEAGLQSLGSNSVFGLCNGPSRASVRRIQREEYLYRDSTPLAYLLSKFTSNNAMGANFILALLPLLPGCNICLAVAEQFVHSNKTLTQHVTLEYCLEDYWVCATKAP